MNLYVALDVSLEFTAVCVMDEEGELVLERKVASDPAAIAGLLFELPERPCCVGLEAGPLSEWLARGLAQAGLDAVSWKRDTCERHFRRWSRRQTATMPAEWRSCSAWDGSAPFIVRP